MKKIKVSSYNWQQGCNPQWLSNNKIIYNDLDFSGKNVFAKTFDMKSNVEETFKYPIQTVLNENSYFSICYKKLTVLRIDYGYTQLKIENFEDIAQDNDYIKLVNIKKNKVSDLVDLNFFKNELSLKKIVGHKFNHIMLSFNKKHMCYIYRFFKNNMRDSVLCITNIKTSKSYYVKKLSQVSHYCWLSDNEILIFATLSGKKSYYKYNILKEKIYHQKWLDFLPDGHPIFDGKRLVLDTYPDKNYYQNLYEGNIKSKKIKLIGSFFHNPLYYGSERCDLHPKFGSAGEIYIDTIAFGKRNLVGIG
ncbi:hypothetical protein OBA40_07450 [Alphaproteobacteria bacterium]|nr:hypothetical protein [Alphaproteobacteria bacterium]